MNMSICTICLDENPNMILDTCNHTFHRACIDQWLEWSVLCPLCRTPVSTTFEIQVAGIPRNSHQAYISMGRRNCILYNQTTVFYHLPYSIIFQIFLSRPSRLLRRRKPTVNLETTTNDDLGFKTNKIVRFQSVHAERILRIFLLHFRR